MTARTRTLRLWAAAAVWAVGAHGAAPIWLTATTFITSLAIAWPALNDLERTHR